MDLRWSLLIGCLVLSSIAMAEEDDDHIPDIGSEEEEDDHITLKQEESRNLRPRAYSQSPTFSNQLPSGFRPTQSLAELAGYQQRSQQEPQESYVSLVPSRPPQQQLYVDEQRQQIRAPHRKQQDHRPSKQQELEDELEDEKEEPDRLSQLLQQSKFDCNAKQTGYYADEALNCEVFHYCQDNVKHSWICPDGFTFHQVHLICMPPNHDNICQKSSKYHFVNEYLYKPINEEEVQRKPSLSLKYSDRYYPAEVYHDDRYDDEEEEEPRHQALQQVARPAQRPTQQPTQVFRSPEEVNIPLVQRRPQRPYEFDF